MSLTNNIPSDHSKSTDRNIYYINTSRETDDESCNYKILNSNLLIKHIPDINPSILEHLRETSSKNNTNIVWKDKQNVAAANKANNEPHRELLIGNKCTGKAEKMTYCRPVLNMYNRDFMYKTMERNTKLQRLIDKLVLVRQKEKKREAWNNYINELKNKHGYYNMAMNNRMARDITNDDIFDFYNTKFTWQVSDTCQNLLDDIYSVSSVNKPSYKQPLISSSYPPYFLNKNKSFFPSTSQGRFFLLNKTYPNTGDFHIKRLYGNKIISNRGFRNIVDCKNKYFDYNFVHDKEKCVHVNPNCCNCSTNAEKVSKGTQDSMFEVNNLAMQTDSSSLKQTKTVSSIDKNEDSDRKYTSDGDSVPSTIKKMSFTNIENKIDKLIDSINEFISHMKTNVSSVNHISISCQSDDEQNEINDKLKLLQNEILRSRKRCLDKTKKRITIEDIIFEELNKSDKVKKDIEEILGGSERGCVHISFDEPTKECSTEVTDSFYNSKKVMERSEDSASSSKNRPTTIAVNTEPLGVLALLRISTQAVKNLLSYMPQIDCASYLAKLQSQESSIPIDFTCNICGASFDRPSRLSDHIEQHNLGNTRNCCVCRHVLDMTRNHIGLFACRHCGQRFTRSYCRELHEQDCAKLLGKKHDISPSRILLH